MQNTPKRPWQHPAQSVVVEKRWRALLSRVEAGIRVDEIDVCWPTDDIIMLIVHFDAACPDVTAPAFLAAHAIIELAAELDAYDPPSFRAFLHAFEAAFSFLLMQKSKDLKHPGRE